MKKENLKAVVLKNIKYKDSDKIYTLLSREKGKISVIAKGVSKLTSKRGVNMDTLNEIIVQIDEHISGQKYLNEVTPIFTFRNIKSDYDLSKYAFYMIELINKVAWEEDSTHGIYDLLITALHRLDDKKEDSIVTVNKFEIKLMQLLGYEPPKKLLMLWRDKTRNKDYTGANLYIKNYINEILQEKMKSLELE